MPIRCILLVLLTAACAAPSSIPTPTPGEGSKAPRPDPDAAKAGPKAPPKDETLGQCLTRKGAHLYGASWCKPCHDQLEWFGEDAKHVPYTDCYPPDHDGIIAVPACRAAGMELTSPYPTWILPDGLKVVGSRSLKWLATSTDCPLRLK